MLALQLGDLLAIGSWDQKLAFYRLSGAMQVISPHELIIHLRLNADSKFRQIIQGKERDLGFDPCSLTYYVNGEYLLIGGSGKKVYLFRFSFCMFCFRYQCIQKMAHS